MKKSIFLCTILALGIFAACKHDYPAPSNEPTVSMTCPSDTVYFQNSILPILVSNCAMSGCHDEHSAREGVILTDYVNVITTGGVNRGNANRSELYRAITNSDEIMPPANYGTLSSEEINLIKTWINQGAKNNMCGKCDTLNFTFATGVWPIVDMYCQNCHSSATSENGYHQYNSWNDIVADSEAFWGSIRNINGYKLMPQNTTGLNDCQQTIIRKWLNAGAPNN
ncbi:MAG: hypothetical protein RLY35_1748 [Bacteroidota bacterium]|jgi:uncharacterized membrane protein